MIETLVRLTGVATLALLIGVGLLGVQGEWVRFLLPLMVVLTLTLLAVEAWIRRRVGDAEYFSSPSMSGITFLSCLVFATCITGILWWLRVL